ncbi:hypothetical protein KSP40_PGU019318 [Platanthera guangdongensis]|uniref:Uncharacterized protein n=1 Tax=Platanthera guangdongensis TaxID=2320717 RepID=A0ABR2LY21_9ASPA
MMLFLMMLGEVSIINFTVSGQMFVFLQRSHPPLNFDSAHLRIQAALLRATLDHPYPPISNATLEFWKATYGKSNNLEFPDCLLPVLDRLSRDGGIILQTENAVGKEAEKTPELNIME